MSTVSATIAAESARNSRTQAILHEAPLPLLLRLASPSALAFLVQSTVSIAELTFVGQLGTVSLAALALVFPLLMLVQMLANGALGGAVGSAIARALGAGDVGRAEALVWHALAIGLTVSLLLFGAFVVVGEMLIAESGALPAVAGDALSYGTIVFAGGPILWSTAFASAVFRGSGDMAFPALLMVIGALIQIPVAGALVLGWFGLPSFGIDGAAYALLLTSLVNFTVLAGRLTFGSVAVRLRWRRYAFRRELFRDIMRVGLLASISPLVVVMTTVIVNQLVTEFGVDALAGYGIVTRLEFLLIPMVFGLGTSMTTVVGVNIGAGRLARAEHIGWVGGTAAAAITGVVGVLLAVAPELWIGRFTTDAATFAAGASYLGIVGPMFAFQGLGLSLYFASQGAGNVVWPVIATLLRFVVGVGGAVITVTWFDVGLEGVFVFLAVGMFVYGTVTALSVRLGAWRKR